MAETAMRPAPPPHLADLQAQARRLTRQAFEGREVSVFGDPDIAEHEARAYLALRVQAYQREMEPFVRAAVRAQALRLPPMFIDEHGRIERQDDPEIRKWLNDAAAMVRRYYELEVPDGQDR